MGDGRGQVWVGLGAILAGLAVAAGAFAAHGLEDIFIKNYSQMPPKKVVGVDIPAAQKYLNDFKTGAEYQMYHALGIIAVGLLLGQRSSKLLGGAAWSFLFGIILFSGCLYVLALSGQRWLGMIVPIGGTLFLVGWGLLGFAVLQRPTATTG